MGVICFLGILIFLHNQTGLKIISFDLEEVIASLDAHEDRQKVCNIKSHYCRDEPNHNVGRSVEQNE